MATNTIYINNWCILVPSTFGRARDTIWPCSMEAVLPSSKQYQRQKRGKKNKFDIERFDAIEACHFCCHLPLCGSLCRRSFGSILEQLHWMMLVQPLAENPQYYYWGNLLRKLVLFNGDYSRSIPIGPYFMDSTAACNCHMGKSRNSHMYAWRVSYLCFRFPSINIFFFQGQLYKWCLWWEKCTCNKAFWEKPFDHVKHFIT